MPLVMFLQLVGPGETGHRRYYDVPDLVGDVHATSEHTDHVCICFLWGESQKGGLVDAPVHTRPVSRWEGGVQNNIPEKAGGKVGSKFNSP